MERKGRLFAAFAATIILTLALLGLGSVSAKAGTRLGVSDSKVWLSTKTSITVTLSGRTAGEDIVVKAGKKDIVKVTKGSWNGDSLVLNIKAKKAGSLKLTISDGSESVKVIVIVKDKSEKTAPQIYSEVENAMVEFDCFDRLGTEYIGAGFFIGDRRILTNYHVIEAASRMTITDYNGKSYTPLRILSYDEEVDLVVVEVKEANKNALVLTKDKVQTGDSIYTIGSPYGYTGTFSRGIVSLAKRNLDGLDYIQITAATSQGSGGGPLLNTRGEVVGVNTLTVKAAQNINFALKISYYDKLVYYAPIEIADFLRGTADKTFSSVVLYNSEKRTAPGIGVLSKATDSCDEEELSAAEVYNMVKDSMVEIRNESAIAGHDSTGSGFFISENIILTNYHVIDGAVKLTIKDYNGNAYEAVSLEKWDKSIDMAILKVKGEGKHSICQVDPSYMPATGETVYTLGSPYWYTGTFSEGMVSMTESYLDGITYFQIEAPISSGSSGGALINRFGRVIGVNTASFLSAQKVNYSLRISYMYELSRTEAMDIDQFYSSNLAKQKRVG